MICRRCINLLDRADYLQVNINSMTEELKTLKSDLSSDIVGKKGLRNEEGDVCPFSCEEPTGPNLLRHVDKNHREDVSVECEECRSLIPGGLEEFQIHKIVWHPMHPMDELLGTMYRRDSVSSDQFEDRRFTNSTQCPYCTIPVRFINKDAFKVHLECLHSDKVNLESIFDSFQFVLDKSVPSKRKLKSENKKEEEEEVSTKIFAGKTLIN